jgi:hypothetical protein
MLFLLVANTYAQPNPDTLWTRTYGGILDDYAYSIKQTSDGGYVIAGLTGGYAPSFSDFYVVKTDAQGDTLWTRTYNESSYDIAYSIQQTTDGGFVLAGNIFYENSNQSGYYVMKTDAQGDTLWTRTHVGTGEAYSIQQTTDSGYIIAGGWHFRVVKMNSQGDILWTRTYGRGVANSAYAIQQTTDGGYVVAGYTSNTPGGSHYDFYVVKTDSQGDTLWTRTYGEGYYDQVAHSIQQTADGGYVIAGFSGDPFTQQGGAWVVKTDAQGDTLWTRYPGVTNTGFGSPSQSIVQDTTDGGFVFAGHTSHDPLGFYVVKYNAQGNRLWTRRYSRSGHEWANSIQQTTDGGFVIAGSIHGPGSGDDFYVVKTGPDASNAAPDMVGAVPSGFALEQNYPNPFNPSTQIAYALPRTGRVSLTISNLLGQNVAVVEDEIQTAGTHTVSFDGSALPSGIYFYRLQTGDFVQTKKMIILK